MLLILVGSCAAELGQGSFLFLDILSIFHPHVVGFKILAQLLFPCILGAETSGKF